MSFVLPKLTTEEEAAKRPAERKVRMTVSAPFFINSKNYDQSKARVQADDHPWKKSYKV